MNNLLGVVEKQIRLGSLRVVEYLTYCGVGLRSYKEGQANAQACPSPDLLEEVVNGVGDLLCVLSRQQHGVVVGSGKEALRAQI